MDTQYEWVIEELEGPGDDPDIRDVNHADTYAEALEFAAHLEHFRIGLVRDTDETRAWAYVEDGVLPLDCEDAFGCKIAPVPLRYRKQFDAAV